MEREVDPLSVIVALHPEPETTVEQMKFESRTGIAMSPSAHFYRKPLENGLGCRKVATNMRLSSQFVVNSATCPGMPKDQKFCLRSSEGVGKVDMDASFTHLLNR